MAVKSDSRSQWDSALVERLAERGFRFTPQRERVYNILLETRDHPTAEQVFLRAKTSMPEISMATVYNCLDALVQCRLIRQVHLKAGATRYCPNMADHGHFCCDQCGGVFDVDWNGKPWSMEPALPKGSRVLHYEIGVHGLCPACASRKP